MNDTLMRTVPFVEARHKGGKQRPKSILIRLSETTSAPGAAFGIAQAWHKAGGKIDSCHYVVDEELTYQCVPDNAIAFSTPFGNKRIISINICAQPQLLIGFWKEKEYEAVFDRTAQLVAELTSKYRIPVRDTNFIEHRRRFDRGGIIIYVKGAWPGSEFLEKVNRFKK